MSVISMKSLLESGVHFGHQTRRWNPKMAPYVFTARNGIHIIDLQKTVQKTKEAYDALRRLTSQGKKVLFVGTKKQARGAIERAAIDCGMYYVSNRWLGGLLTNWNTVKKSIARLKRLETMEAENSFEQEAKTKKEALSLKRELEKSRATLGGIKDMATIPEILFVIDPKKEEIAVKEAKKLGLTVFAVIDTNCDPELIDYPIPGNDDAIRAITLFLDTMANAVKEGTGGEVIQPNFTEDEDIDPAQLYSGEYDESGRFIKDEEKAAEALANEELEKNAAAAAEGQVVASVTVPAENPASSTNETQAPEANN
ncbi:MAG: 30S ribosomal protein S2 [Leptospiraceae bacterium]|nr:30S ribosomal protein S2 [Leptospiraceae bacterium]